jgi:outer membrane protein TolC
VNRRALCLAASLLWPAAAAAQPVALPDVLRSVEDHFPLIEAAERDRDVADAELLAAEGAFDPQWRTRVAAGPLGYYQPLTLDTALTQPTTLWGAQLFVGYRFGQGLSYTGIPIYDGKLETNSLGEVRAGVAIPLWRNGPIDRARANVRRAEIGRTVASLGVAQQRLEAARAATVAYWEWVAAGRRVAVAEALLRLAEARDEGLGTRVARGDLPAFERTDNARAIVQRQGFVVAARRALEQTAIALSLYLRDAGGRPALPDPARLPGALPEPAALPAGCAARTARAAAGRRPEVRRLEAQRAQQEVERELAENQRRPAVDLVVAVSQDLGDGPQSRRPPVLEAGLVLDIPLRNRAADGRARAASATAARLDAQAEMARDRANADLRDAASAMEAARQRWSLAQTELGLAEGLAGQERTRLALGEGTLLVLNLREQAAAEASLREVDARAEFQRALAAWRLAAVAMPGEAAACEP